MFKRHVKDEILMLASDGLWDVMPNQEAADLAMRCIRRARDKGASPKAAARVAATILTKAAVDRGSRDNITVMVIDLSRGGITGRSGGGGSSDSGASDGGRPARAAGGRLAAAAAAAEAAAAAGGAGKRPVPQRIINEQPSLVAAPAPAQPQAPAPERPAAAEQEPQQQQPLATEGSIAKGGPFGRSSPFDGAAAGAASAPAAPAPAAGGKPGPFAAAAAAAPAADEPVGSGTPPMEATRQASSSPFGAGNLAPF